jgi:putative ABC transport system ATP-binding protein
MIKLDNISKTYFSGEVTSEVIKGLDLQIDKAEFISIVGPSGSGKSTILNMIGLLDYPTNGNIYFEDQVVSNLSKKEATDFRAHNIGFIFQDFNLISAYSVYENIEFPLSVIHDQKGDDVKNRIEKVLREIDMLDHAHKLPEQLSGGQKQRVAVARALVTNPKLVLADEPTANLDSTSAKKVIDLMKKMQEEFHTTFIFSTHDTKIVDNAKRIVTLQDGKIVEDRLNTTLNK